MRAKEFINETASAGASGAGGIATAPAAMPGMQRRKKKVGEAGRRYWTPGKWVDITKGRYAGTSGTIGEVVYAPGGRIEALIIDINGDYQEGSVRVGKHQVRAINAPNAVADPLISEAHDDEMVAVDFNNESAMELAQSKFDFDWDGDQMIIHEKHLGRLEDLLDSHGYFEPDDYEIEPAMFAAEGMADGYAYEVYVGEPRTGKVKVGRKTIDFDAIRLANPNGRGHLKKRGIVYAQNREQALQKARQQYGKTAQVEPYMG